MLVHFTDEASVPTIKTARALRPGKTGFVFLTMPDMIGKPVAQVEHELGLAPGRGSWVFLVRIEPEKVVYRGFAVPFASGRVHNPGGAPEFITWYPIPEDDWLFNGSTESLLAK